MKASHEDTKARSNVKNTLLIEVLTYLRQLNIPLGLLINIGSPTFKEGCQRIVNGSLPFVASRLRVKPNRRSDMNESREDTKARSNVKDFAQ